MISSYSRRRVRFCSLKPRPRTHAGRLRPEGGGGAPGRSQTGRGGEGSRTGEGRRGRTPTGCGQEGGGRAPGRSQEGAGDKVGRTGGGRHRGRTPTGCGQDGRGRAPGRSQEGRGGKGSRMAKAAEDARREAAARKAEDERLAEPRRRGGKGSRTGEGPGRTAAGRCCKGRRVYANGRGFVRGTGSCHKSAKNAGFSATRKAGRARGPLPQPRQHSRCPAVLSSRRPGWACRCRFQTRRNTRPPRACAPERPRFET